VVESSGSLSAKHSARYASIRTLSELSLFGGSVHTMRSVFSATKVLQSSERSLSPPAGGKTKSIIAQSPNVRSEARYVGQEEPWPSTTLFRIVAAAVAVVFTSSL
jgi:hypothetical protein